MKLLFDLRWTWDRFVVYRWQGRVDRQERVAARSVYDAPMVYDIRDASRNFPDHVSLTTLLLSNIWTVTRNTSDHQSSFFKLTTWSHDSKRNFVTFSPKNEQEITWNDDSAWRTFLPPATKLGQGYILTGICHSVNRGVLSQHALQVVSQHALQ